MNASKVQRYFPARLEGRLSGSEISYEINWRGLSIRREGTSCIR